MRALIKLDPRPFVTPAWWRKPARLRSTWFELVAYCTSFGYGDRLQGARTWPPRQWQFVWARVTARTVGQLVDHELAKWDGDDLVLAHCEHLARRAVG